MFQQKVPEIPRQEASFERGQRIRAEESKDRRQST